MEEVGSLIFLSANRPEISTSGCEGGLKVELVKVFIILSNFLLLATKPNPNQALSGLWYKRHSPKQPPRLTNTLHPLL